MPKEPPVERFRISCEVEAANLGPTIAQLTKLGLTNVNFDLIEDVRTYAKKVMHEIKSEDFLRGWIKHHPTFKAIETVKAFEADGRTNGAAYTALRYLTEKKILKKLGEGNYSRTDVKHLPAPKKKPKKTKGAKAAEQAQRYEVSNQDFILKIARRNHGRFSLDSMKNAFEKDGRNRASVNPAASELTRRKLIQRVGDGHYVLLNTMAEQPKSNGNGAAVEATHG